MGGKVVPAVKAIVEKDGRILVLKTEASNKTYDVLPGGKIEYGEKSRDALERELMEEISCSSEIGGPLGMYHFFKGPEGKGDQVAITVYKAEIGNQEINIDKNPVDEGIKSFSWMKPEELIEKSENSSLQRFLDNSFRNQII